MTTYRNDFDETKYMSFLIKDDEILEKYNEIWEKLKDSLKKEFDSKPVCNEKYLKAKTKSSNGKINTNFHGNEIPKEDSQYVGLSVVLIDPLFRVRKNYHPQMFLEECKYVVKEKKIPKYITDDIEISSNDSDKENSNEEDSDEKNADKEKSDEKNSDEGNLKNTNIAHFLKLVFEACKKIFFINFFVYI